jgi:hypothetical protein
MGGIKKGVAGVAGNGQKSFLVKFYKKNKKYFIIFQIEKGFLTKPATLATLFYF